VSALVVARQVHGDLKAKKRQLRKLSGKMFSVRRIEEAKNVLMRSRSISEAKAYDPIRTGNEQTGQHRRIAQTILNANAILSLGES
jgi:AmiR/NasT family two-component response regulator